MILAADLNDKNQYIICHAMCDDIGKCHFFARIRQILNEIIAGTARRAEIKPDIASNFPYGPSGRANEKYTATPRLSLAQSPKRNTAQEEPRLHDGIDAFEGDDLDFDDFLATSHQHQRSVKEVTNVTHFESDETDWLSIDGSPQRPQKVTESNLAKDDEWVTDMGPQDTEMVEPIRLANGNWACNHKCKDKTR